MKKCVVILILISLSLICFGCNSDIDKNSDGYKNTETKKPSTATAHPVNTDDQNDNLEGPSETDSENLPVHTGNPSQTAENTQSTEFPTATGTPGDVQNNETDMHISGNTSSSTSAPTSTATNKHTAYPTVSPTAPPVITQGPSNYFVLTLDNGGGGGYVYINQSVDSETGEAGATNVNKGWFAAGSYASISAVPYEGCTFGGWFIGDDFVSPEADYTFVMPERDYPLTAMFIY